MALLADVTNIDWHYSWKQGFQKKLFGNNFKEIFLWLNFLIRIDCVQVSAITGKRWAEWAPEPPSAPQLPESVCPIHQ